MPKNDKNDNATHRDDKRNKSGVRRKKKPDLVARNPFVQVQGYFKPDSSARHAMCLPTTAL